MLEALTNKKERKVEYIELIYDLIFVYVIGRNNTLLHTFEGGFTERGMFFAYVMCTLAVIQIWTFTTYYINLYGKNSPREYVGLFINMFLMYFIAEATTENWKSYHTQYHIAWALILFNICFMYVFEYKNHKSEPVHLSRIKRMSVIIFIEAVLVLLAIAEFDNTGTSYVSLAAILFGIFSVLLSSRKTCSGLVDFNHLSERIMLYVVFTFGEMIIALASYFEGTFNLNSLYFSLMGFLIVVGLFLSYGVVYDKIIDREKQTNGIAYILVHIFIIFFLNNITAALEFMREEEVKLLPKIIFLFASIIMYYVCFIFIGGYSKQGRNVHKGFYAYVLISCAVFAALMLLLRNNMYLNIAITVIYVFSVYIILFVYEKKHDKISNE